MKTGAVVTALLVFCVSGAARTLPEDTADRDRAAPILHDRCLL